MNSINSITPLPVPECSSLPHIAADNSKFRPHAMHTSGEEKRFGVAVIWTSPVGP